MGKLPSEMSRSEFVRTYGGLFEHSSWVVEQAFDDGCADQCDSADSLHQAFLRVLDKASRMRKLDLIRAHPELGDKARIKTRESAGEQGAAGLDNCTAEQYAQIKALNATYGKRFGFPFILAVKGKTPAKIAQVMRLRLNNHASVEFDRALVEIGRIARFRLSDLLG